MDKIEALAQAWASIDGKLERFIADRDSVALNKADGSYAGYMAEAREMERRPLSRGYAIVPASEEA